MLSYDGATRNKCIKQLEVKRLEQRNFSLVYMCMLSSTNMYMYICASKVPGSWFFCACVMYSLITVTTYMHVYICIWIDVYVYVHVCTCMCMYVYTYVYECMRSLFSLSSLFLTSLSPRSSLSGFSLSSLYAPRRAPPCSRA